MNERSVRIRLRQLPDVVATQIRALRENPLPDRKAQALTMKWARQGVFLPPTVKDQAALTYIEYVLGLGRETALKFVDHNESATDAVGMAQSYGIAENVPEFWEKVSEVNEGLLSPRELSYLKTVDTKGKAAFKMLYTWQNVLPNSNFIDELLTIAHAYK